MPTIDVIGDLMNEFDLHPFNEPTSVEMKHVLDELTSEKNREALRTWYAQRQNIEFNPRAANLRIAIERVIAEKLQQALDREVP